MRCIWQYREWPRVVWKADELLRPLGEARLEQGKLLSRVAGLGFKLKDEAQADILTEEALKTAAIEGRSWTPTVRSSVARRLGLPAAGRLPPTGLLMVSSKCFWMQHRIIRSRLRKIGETMACGPVSGGSIGLRKSGPENGGELETRCRLSPGRLAVKRFI